MPKSHQVDPALRERDVTQPRLGELGPRQATPAQLGSQCRQAARAFVRPVEIGANDIDESCERHIGRRAVGEVRRVRGLGRLRHGPRIVRGALVTSRGAGSALEREHDTRDGGDHHRCDRHRRAADQEEAATRDAEDERRMPHGLSEVDHMGRHSAGIEQIPLAPDQPSDEDRAGVSQVVPPRGLNLTSRASTM